MTYRCIVFDYDNTIVDSFPNAQYLAMRYACGKMGMKEFTKDELVTIDRRCRIGDEFRRRFPDRYDECTRLFTEYLIDNPPSAYDGMKGFMEGFVKMGGRICIVSNSTVDLVKIGIEFNRLPAPDRIYGWDSGEMYRKPNTAALYEISQDFDISPDEMIVVDDKESGLEMARSFGAASAISGWGIIGDEEKEMLKKTYPGSCFCEEVGDLSMKIYGR